MTGSVLFFFVFITVLAFILLGISVLLSPHTPYSEKNSSFECGYSSFRGQNRTEFSISFFIFGLLFLILDLEILLIYPYTVSAYSNGGYGLFFVIVFLLVLTVGFAYELGRGALKIYSRQTGYLGDASHLAGWSRGRGNNPLPWFKILLISIIVYTVASSFRSLIYICLDINVFSDFLTPVSLIFYFFIAWLGLYLRGEVSRLRLLKLVFIGLMFRIIIGIIPPYLSLEIEDIGVGLVTLLHGFGFYLEYGNMMSAAGPGSGPGPANRGSMDIKSLLNPQPEPGSQAPGQAPVQAPEPGSQAPVQAPVQAIDQAPVQAIDQAPVQAIDQAPVQAIDQAPVQAIVRAPVQAPTQAVPQSNPGSQAPLRARKLFPPQPRAVTGVERENLLQSIPPREYYEISFLSVRNGTFNVGKTLDGRLKVASLNCLAVVDEIVGISNQPGAKQLAKFLEDIHNAGYTKGVLSKLNPQQRSFLNSMGYKDLESTEISLFMISQLRNLP